MKRILTTILVILTSVSVNVANSKTTEMSSDEYEYIKLKMQQQNEADSLKYFEMVNRFRQQAEKKGLNEDVHLSYVCLSGYLTNLGHIEHAKAILKQFRQHCEAEGKIPEDLYDAWQSIVLYYYNTSQMIDAVTVLKQMQEYATKQNDTYGLASVYITYGTFYNFSYNEAMKNLNKALEYSARPDNSADLYYVYYMMAVAANRSNRHEQVLEFTDKMIKCAPGHPYVQQLYNYLRLEVYVELGERVKAKECYDALNEAWENYDIYGTIQSGVVLEMVKYLCTFGQAAKAKDLLKYIGLEMEKLDAEVCYYRALDKYDKALEAQKQLTDLWINRLDDIQQAEMMNANAAYNNQRLEEEKRLMTERYHRITLFGVIAFAILLSIWIVYLISVLRKLKKAQAELQLSHDIIVKQNEKVKASEEMKTAFIQSMSHEIRTPLNHIVGFANLLAVDGFPQEEREVFASNIHEASKHMLHITDNMLQMSDIISSTERPKTEDVNLNSLCSALIDSVNAGENSKGLDIKLVANREFTVHSNGMYLDKIIRNLLENAVKFTEQGGIEIAIEQVEDSVIMKVSDTGCGIPADKHEFVFERFAKVDSFVPGVGVGLYLCRLMINRLGGRIYVDPEYTAGCRIVVEVQ